MLHQHCTRDIFLCIYQNPENIDGYSCIKTLGLKGQFCVTTSYDVHILIAFRPDVNWDGDITMRDEVGSYMVCFDVILNGRVKRSKKSLRGYERNYKIQVVERQYKRVRRFLDKSIGKPFNQIDYWCGFAPILKHCLCFISCGNKGYYCAQLIADALACANIIKLKGNVITRGYPTPMICCCIPRFLDRVNKPVVSVHVPAANRMTVEMLIDVIRRDNESTFTCLSTSRNGNDYASTTVVEDNSPQTPTSVASHVKIARHKRRKRRNRRREKHNIQYEKLIGVSDFVHTTPCENFCNPIDDDDDEQNVFHQFDSLV